jgi:hypothetical protein
VLAQITALAPSSFALEIAIVIPRSLKLPVGFRPSNLTYTLTSRPIRSESERAGIRGVLPSRRVIVGVFSLTGRKGRYCSIKPRQPPVFGGVATGEGENGREKNFMGVKWGRRGEV